MNSAGRAAGSRRSLPASHGADARLALFEPIDVTADQARTEVFVPAAGDLLATPLRSRRPADSLPHTKRTAPDRGHAVARERPREGAGLITGFPGSPER